MKKKSSLTFLLLFMHLHITYAQQVITDTSLQPQQLLDQLTMGNCVNGSNAISSINGNTSGIPSYGIFNSGDSNFPLTNGIVLSTGNANAVGNSVITENLSDGSLNWGTDSDIESILGISETLNATSLEFDITSVNQSIGFRYLFASDEYQQNYPCNFQDVFAILIKEHGTSDPYVNIALIPDTSTPISTSSIHPQILNGCEAENTDYFEGYNIGNTNFDGQTVVLNARAMITPGITYSVKFVIADHIDQRFDSAVFIESDSFGTILDLGPDQSICGRDLTLNANIDNPLASYNWFLDGNALDGENSPTVQVDQSGNYSVEVSLNASDTSCLLTDSINVEIIPFQEANFITDLTVCDEAPSDGVYNFDFTALKNDEIFAGLPSTNYSISYHLSEIDAQNFTDPINGIYQNIESTETIFARIESLSGDCLQVGSFDILVNSEPNSTEITINVCDNNVSDFTLANIYILDPLITEFDDYSNVGYYLNEEDAINEVNEITEYPDFTNNPIYMVARIESTETVCYSIERVYFNYLTSPDLGIEKFIIDACLSPDYYDNQGSVIYTYEDAPVTFNLEDAISEIQQVYPGANVRLLIPVIGNPRLLTITSASTTIPIGISFDETYCETSISLELHKNVLFNTIEANKEIIGCDDPLNDGIVDFDLTTIIDDLKQNLPNIDIVIYDSEEDRENEQNAIDIFSPYSVSSPTKELYITSNYNGSCNYESNIILTLAEAPIVSPQVVEACGSFNFETNTTAINLMPYIRDMQQGLINVGVTFYLTEEHAINNINPITSVDVMGNYGEIYTRITNDNTGCYAITILGLNILDSLNLASPPPIIVCDDNLDGFGIVDLESALAQFSIDLTEFNTTFYQTSRNAIEDREEILNPNSFNAQNQSIYVRIQRIGLECFTITEFEVKIYNQPVISEISDYISCIENSNTFGDFFLEQKDLDIINDQQGMQVLYFETENDAMNRIDPINKTTAYRNTSNPQIIYVRLENEAESSCYATSSLNIEVRQAPVFNPPTDIFRCNINGNGLNIIDLNEKVDEITDGSIQDLSVTFHLTPLNANLGTNEISLNFAMSSNPQQIYVRVLNLDSGCYEVATFNIKTLQLPEVSYGQSMVACGHNYEFVREWDLTEIELLILDGRQYGIEFNYYQSETDLYNNENTIIDPESYYNSSNPQTIYAKVENTITGCFSSVPFELIINGPPQVNDIETYSICDNEDNIVDLSEIDLLLLDDTFNTLISYHDSEADAEASINALSINYPYTNNVQTLYARVVFSTTRCYAVYPFQLVVNPLPVANQPNDLVVCDDNLDGLLELDLSSQNTAILNGQNSNEHTISYFNSEENATESFGALEANYVAFDGEVIFVRLENNETGCFDVTQFTVDINPLPDIDIEDQTLCLNDLPLSVSAETGNPLDTYLWSTSAITSEIEITEVGTYSVTVTNEFGCESTSTFNVTESESAIIDVVETIDFSDPNNITITVNGIGDYLYQLNDLPFQSSNVFVNVPIGYNTLTIMDQNGCARVTREVLVIDAPKHMTPNGDGDFDTWHIVGVETLPGTIIHIFDRRGKLLAELGHETAGWDGTYNGNDMPADDYWYVANVVQDGRSFQVNGHFALRR